MGLDKIGALAQFLVKGKTPPIGVDGKVKAWDYNKTNRNKITGADDRTSRGDWCYEGDGIQTETIGGTFSIDYIIADVDSGAGWLTDQDISGILSGRVLTFASGVKYKDIRAYVTSISPANLRFRDVAEAETGTIALDQSGNGNDGTLSNASLHTPDDTVLFSHADDRGAGLVAKNLNRAQTIPNTIVLSGAFKARYKFRIYPYFRPFVAGHKYYLTLRGSGITLTLQFLSITPDLDTASIRLINGATNAVYESSGVRVLNTLLTLEVTRDVSNNVTFNLSNDLGESATSGLLPFALNYEINEFGYLATVLNDWVHGSMESVEIWNGVPFTEGEAEYEYTNFINSNTNTGSAGSTFNLVNKLLIDGIVPLLEDGITPANPNIPQAQYVGAYKDYLQIKNSPNVTVVNNATLTFSGTSPYSVPASVEINEGTATGTYAAGVFTIGASGGGTIDSLTVDGVTVYMCANSGLVQNWEQNAIKYQITFSAAVWTVTNSNAFLQAKGGTDQSGVYVPAALDANGNPTDFDALDNPIPYPALSGKALRLGFGNEIDLNPEAMPFLTQLGIAPNTTITLEALNEYLGKLMCREEVPDLINQIILNARGDQAKLVLDDTTDSNTVTFAAGSFAANGIVSATVGVEKVALTLGTDSIPVTDGLELYYIRFLDVSGNVVEIVPCHEGSDTTIEGVRGLLEGTISGTTTTVWQPQSKFDAGLLFGEEENTGVKHPGLVDADFRPLGISARSGSTAIDNRPEAIKGQRSLNLTKKAL
jgi:hypothetical protein